MDFQWDDSNHKHIMEDYPDRGNSVGEVESVFTDPDFRPVPDRVDSRGEQQYSGVGISNQNRLLLVAYSLRDDHIRPISCRPASRKERNRYAQITQKSPEKGGSEADSRD